MGCWWAGGFPVENNATQLLRVEKTREQRELARGTLSDLPRNTQAQKQRRISPFIAGGEKIDNKVHYK